MIRSTENREKVAYIDSLREIIQLLVVEYHDEFGEQAEALVGGEDEIFEEDAVDDAEYAVDASDEGRTALFDLLITAPKICNKHFAASINT